MISRTLFASFAAFLVAAAAVAAPPEPDVQFLFDGNLSSADSAHTGAAVGNSVGFNSSVTPFSYGGNQSLELGGSADYVDVASLIGSMTGDSAVTISMWVRNREAIGNDRPFLGLATAGNSDNGGARYDNAGANGGGNDVLKLSIPGRGDYETASNVQAVDLWQHVALVFDGTDLDVYIDGTLDTPTDDGITAGAIGAQTEFLIGNGPKGPSTTWNGFIDEVGIWFDQALTEEDIGFLSQNSLTALAVPEPGSIAIWTLLGFVGLFFGWQRMRRRST